MFVGSGAYIALADASDGNHAAAVTFPQTLRAEVARVTSWGVIAETYTWLRYHIRSGAAQRWLDVLQASAEVGTTRVIYPDAGLDALSRRQLARFPDHALSCVDALTLAIAQTEPRIDAIFGFDERHMILAGVPVLPGRAPAPRPRRRRGGADPARRARPPGGPR